MSHTLSMLVELALPEFEARLGLNLEKHTP
jgi:hypothetical protein